MRVLAAVAVAIPLAFGTSRLMAQGNSDVHVPDSSVEQPGDRGHKAHTNHVISLRGGRPDRGGPPSGPSGKSPQQIQSTYGLTSGGTGIIAIVDAFDYPTALNDFNKFSSQFGLPQETGNGNVFQVKYATGVRPTGNCGWAQEAALDIEWAHAMAPSATIMLVETASNSFADLLQGVDYAESHGASQISMSWGGSEFSDEVNYEAAYFDKLNVTYVAASGDTGGKTIYPGTSQYVVSAGGTSLPNNSISSETAWSGSGGGPSKYIGRPSFQSVLPTSIGGVDITSSRAVPDISFDADPNTGVAVYDSTRCQGLSGWMVFGGTSVSSPAIAGIINSANHQKGRNELQYVYVDGGYDGGSYYSNFHDVTVGSAGSFNAGTHYDLVTGIGSSVGNAGK
ncbi:MAG TPA: S53 family peptidase [Vicinamibacterales bacterium]